LVNWLASFRFSGPSVMAAVLAIVLLIAFVMACWEDPSAVRQLRTPLSRDTVTRRLQRELEDW
jgi:hypothetical protein